MRITEYLTASEKSPFAGWFDKLDVRAAAKVVAALTRIDQGNLSNVKSVGSGVADIGSTMVPAIASTSAERVTKS